MIEFKCGQCGAEMEAPDSLAGGVERCPQCGSPNRVPKPVRPATVAPKPLAELSQAAPTVPHAGPLSNGPAARSARNRKPLLILAAIAGVVAVAAVGGFLAGHIGRSNPLQSKSVAGDQAPKAPSSAMAPVQAPAAPRAVTAQAPPIPGETASPTPPTTRSISGSVWLTKKNGSSDIMRGMTVAILQQTIEGKDVAEAMLLEVPKWEKLAKDYRDMAADCRKNMEKYEFSTGDWAKMAKDEEAEADKKDKMATKLREIASHPPAVYDTLEAYRLLKEGSTCQYLVGLPLSGIMVQSTTTNVDGKYRLTNVQAGKYYLYGISGSEAYVVEWIIPITVGLQDVTLDLFNDNAETIRN